MASTRLLAARDDAPTSTGLTPTMQKVLIALVVLSFAASAITAGLYFFRQSRQRRRRAGFLYGGASKSSLPIYEKRGSRALSISTTGSRRTSHFVQYEQEKLFAVGDGTSPPPSPIPEIRITFPDEEDAQGKRQSGRVVVVRMGEQGGVGLEPVQQEQHAGERFETLDLERIGGLKEKEVR